MKILLGTVAVLLLLANVVSFWYGSLHARQSAGVERVTTSQLANAMQHDEFYSSYGGAAVLFSGKVAHIEQKNDVKMVSFDTGASYGVSCQFSGSTNLAVGHSVSVVAPAGSADRLPHGVLLHNCLVN